ncbi:MAG: hypothetical protein S4CHLAM6_13470 [Chlamydiae bacterium]|nr:hypothetical protein [Chlamydiota bacterium]
MDTKKLYIKSQKNTLTWGLAVASILFLLAIFSIFATPKGTKHYTFDFWANLIIYTSIFVSLLYNRFKISPKSAIIALFSYLALFATYLVSMTIKAKQTYQLFLTMGFKSPKVTFALCYGLTVLIMLAMSYLLYRVYLATKNVETLSQPEH